MGQLPDINIQPAAWIYLGEFDVSVENTLPSNYSEVMVIGSKDDFSWGTVQVIFPKGYISKTISVIGKNDTEMVVYVNASSKISVTTAYSASNVTKYRLYYR